MNTNLTATYTIVAQGTGAFPPSILIDLQAWPRTQTDGVAMFRTMDYRDPRLIHRVLLVTHKDPRNMLVAAGGRRSRWDLWAAQPHDFPPEAPREIP